MERSITLSQVQICADLVNRYMFRGISAQDKNADYVIPQLLNEDELKHELEKSLHKEDYEKAAEYRDELHQREQRKMSAK